MQEVEIKGWRNGLLIVVPEEGAWYAARAALEARLNEAKDGRTFWRGAQVTLDLGNRLLEAEPLGQLSEWLREAYGLIPLAAVATHPETRDACEKLVLKTYAALPAIQKATADWDVPAPRPIAVTPPTAAPPPPRPAPTALDTGVHNNALYLFRNVRSGQRIEHDGNLVICGDVSPDAEVVATGDIVVVGKLRGRPHAGCLGDESARIIAGELRAPQLRIAGAIAAAPPEDRTRPQGARSVEVARIEEGEIQVFPL